MSYSSEVLADAPVGYWKLDETGGTTAADSSGNGFDGTYGGTFDTAHFELGVAPLIAQGHAVNSHGTSNGGAFVSIATESAFSVGGHITLEAWVNFTQTGIRPMISSDNGSGTGRYFQYRLNAGKPEVILFDTGGTSHTVTGPTAINDGNTHHVVATYDGAHVILYVDGVQVISTAATFALRTTNAGLMLLEQLAGVTASQYTGIFDEAAIYTTALSAARVLAHYNAREAIDATFVGKGALTTTMRLLRRFTATIAGQASLSAAFNGFSRFTASIAGKGSLSAPVSTGGSTVNFAASIAGRASLSATLAGLKRFTATITGKGSLSAPVSAANFTATITGKGSLRAAPTYLPDGLQLQVGMFTPTVAPEQTSFDALELGMFVPTILAGTPAPAMKLQFGLNAPGIAGPQTLPATRLVIGGQAPAMIIPIAGVPATLKIGMFTPTIQPLSVPAIAVRLGAQTPGQIMPVQVPPFVLNLLADAPDIAFASFLILSAILKIGMFAPTVTPLNPPAPSPGGVSATVTL